MRGVVIPKLQDVYRGWWVAIAGMLALTLLIGSQTGGSMGLFFVALMREFDWSRTLLSGAFSVVRIEGSFLGPIEGFLTDRIGSHRMVLIGSVIAGVGFFILASVSHPVTFYLALLVITGGVGIGGFIPVVTAVNWWFTERRNRATGLALAGVAMGAIWSPLIAWGITSFGWRPTSVVMGVVLIVVGIPLSRVLKPPTHMRLEITAEATDVSKEQHTTEAVPDFTLREAMRTPAFWLIPISHGTNGFTTSAVYVHGVPRLTDASFTLGEAGAIMATYGIVEALMRVFGSFLGDRMDKRIGIAAYCTVQSLGVVVLSIADTLPLAMLFAVLFAIGHGGRGPLIVVIRGEYFGQRSFGTIMGIGGLITGPIGIVTPIFLGVLYDIQGTYLLGFLIMSLLTFLGGFVMLFVKRPSLPRA